MSSTPTAIAGPAKDDRIYPITRWISVVIVPFLLLAFVVLYFFPGESGQRFAWEIKPPMTAVFMGAGYLGGATLFLHAVFDHRWHRVAAGYLPVTAFTVSMLLATVLHWDRFIHGHLAFTLWLGLYVLTPFLVPWMWFNNRPTDPGTPESADASVPPFARLSLKLLGVFLLLFAVTSFVYPIFAILIWPWKLTPLTARVLGGWFALLGVGGVVIGRDARWSAWKVGIESIAVWHVLVLIGAVLHQEDFTNASVVNWYTLSVLSVLLGMASLYVLMELRKHTITPTVS